MRHPWQSSSGGTQHSFWVLLFRPKQVQWKPLFWVGLSLTGQRPKAKCIHDFIYARGLEHVIHARLCHGKGAPV